MPLFVIFIFGAIVIGTGAMLAPAWPTVQPRIGLNAALALGVVVGGALFWAMLFSWNTLVIDYLLFAIITVIFLGGTLSYGQTRAEKRGEELSDHEQGWPGPRDLLFFALAALIFIIPVLVLPVPLDTDAQGFGYLALLARMGGGFNTLAPFHEEVSYLYSPAFTLLVAYLSQQTGQGIHHVQLAVAAVLGLLNVWLAFDLGSELRDKRLGRAMSAAMLGGLGLFLTYMDSHYTALMGLVFAQAFVIFVMRYLRHNLRADAIAAGLMLGAVGITHPDTLIILALGYVPWLLLMWLGRPRPTLHQWGMLVLAVPGIALLATAPWLWSLRDQLGAEIVSPFMRSMDYLRTLVVFHGVWVLPVALIGLIVGWRQRTQAVLMALGWLILIADFSAFGITEALFGWLPVFRYDYPFSIAWHGPVIPYSILAGVGLLWLWDHGLAARLTWVNRYAHVLLGAAIALALLLLIFSPQILAFSKGRVSFYGAFASAADVEALTWIRDNTPTDARLLNFPGTRFDNSHEGDWVPVISERDSVFYRWQPFFSNQQASLAEQDRLRAFWYDPADPAHAALLKEAEVDYVVVPQIVGNPESFATAWRWNEPFAWQFPMQSSVLDAPYLELILDVEGAQVFRVLSD